MAPNAGKKLEYAGNSYSMKNVYGELNTAKLNSEYKPTGNILGDGTFGVVTGNTRNQLAVKQFKDPSKRSREFLIDKTISNALSDPVRMKYTLLLSTGDMNKFENGGKRNENIMELCLAGDNLTDVMKSIKTTTTYRGYTRLDVFDMVAAATIHILSDLHDKNIHHCDIKLDNLMICQDKSDANIMTARLIDFGQSRDTCRSGSPLFVPNDLTREKVIKFTNALYSTNLSWIPATPTGHAGIQYNRQLKPAYADKYALAITLAIILGNLTGPRLLLCKQLMNDTVSWKEAKGLVDNFPKSPDSKLHHGGNKRENKRTVKKTVGKWKSTKRTVTIKKRGYADVTKTIFRNQTTGELRVKKAKSGKDGVRTFVYVNY